MRLCRLYENDTVRTQMVLRSSLKRKRACENEFRMHNLQPVTPCCLSLHFESTCVSAGQNASQAGKAHLNISQKWWLEFAGLEYVGNLSSYPMNLGCQHILILQTSVLILGKYLRYRVVLVEQTCSKVTLFSQLPFRDSIKILRGLTVTPSVNSRFTIDKRICHVSCWTNIYLDEYTHACGVVMQATQ
jgi:hypothetical protein